MTFDPLKLFDFKTQQWTDLERGIKAYQRTWGRSGRHVYFMNGFSEDSAVFRVRISDHKLEKVVSLKNVRLWAAGFFGVWFGLTPDDSPYILRDVGIEEIFAMDIQY